MKNIVKSLFLAAAVLLTFAACKDDEGIDSSATPVVKYIRSTDPAQAEVYLTSASMGDMIAIIGTGLEGVCSVRFNDVEALLNPAYVTSTAVIVSVPGTLPAETTNTVTLTTGKGRRCVVENFVTRAPAPVINGMSCEWARPGEEVTLYGDYFFNNPDGSDPELSFGGLPAEIVSHTTTRIVTKVPDALDSSSRQRIMLANENGTGRSTFYMYDRSDIFIDFEDLSWDWWGRCTNDIFSENGIDGSYMLMKGESAVWNWNEDLSLFYCNINEDLSVNRELIGAAEDPADYSLKFELRVDAWVDLAMAMWFTGEYNTFSIDGPEAQCHWKGYAEGYPAEKWVTVSIPLSDFFLDKEENEKNRVLTTAQMKSFCIFFFGGLENDAAAGQPLQIAVDNFRLVKKQ